MHRSTDIFGSNLRITAALGIDALDRNKFNTRMNSLKKPSAGAILSANRTGWYEFTEKVIGGSVRLRAEQAHVQSEVDHPTAKRKLGLRSA